MKKELLSWIVRFYKLRFNLSLLRLGYYVGFRLASSIAYNTPLKYYKLNWWYIIIPVFYLLLSCLGRYFVREREYTQAKTYCIMGSITFTYYALHWVYLILNRLPTYAYSTQPIPFFEHITYPAIHYSIATVISVLYFICAGITKKEERIAKARIDQ